MEWIGWTYIVIVEEYAVSARGKKRRLLSHIVRIDGLKRHKYQMLCKVTGRADGIWENLLPVILVSDFLFGGHGDLQGGLPGAFFRQPIMTAATPGQS